ncbi:MAG: hypothetical protein GQ559_02930 [Desulfobulbaceae bacterium]|nr:hypothetical protein [Desulfobulbaceae bacterium]
MSDYQARGWRRRQHLMAMVLLDMLFFLEERDSMRMTAHLTVRANI